MSKSYTGCYSVVKRRVTPNPFPSAIGCYTLRAMKKKTGRRKQYRRTFIKAWREYRKLSLRQLADDMVDENGNLLITPQSIGRIENGKQPYNQVILEGLAKALDCSVADLLIRNPTDTQAPWELWNGLPETGKRQAVEMLRVIKETTRH